MRGPIGLMLALVLVMGLFTAHPVAARCPDIEGWPSFSDVAEEARRVVVGTVTRAHRGVATELRVDEILRGRSRQVVDLAVLRSRLGKGAEGCAFDGLVEADVGNRIAIAFNGKVEGWPRFLDSVALLDADEAHPNASGLERLTVQQARLLLGHEANGSTVAVPQGTGQTADVFESLLRGLSGGLFDIVFDTLGIDVSDDNK